MPSCKPSPFNPGQCCVHPEHAFQTMPTSLPKGTEGFLTELEKFEQTKFEKTKKEAAASGFSEINLHQAVHDDMEKKLPPITSRTVKVSLREMLKDGKFKSPSKAILTRTVRQFKAEEHAKATAKKRAILDRLKLGARTKIQMTKISQYMSNLAVKERETKQRRRRLEMGLPVNLKIAKRPVQALRVVRALSSPPISTVSQSVSGEGDVRLPNLPKQSSQDIEICSSYGEFLYASEVGQTRSQVRLPTINSPEALKVPSRPALAYYRRTERKIRRVPPCLERFKYMRIKN